MELAVTVVYKFKFLYIFNSSSKWLSFLGDSLKCPGGFADWSFPSSKLRGKNRVLNMTERSATGYHYISRFPLIFDLTALNVIYLIPTMKTQ